MSRAPEYVAVEWMRRYDEMKEQRDRLREVLEFAESSLTMANGHPSVCVEAALEKARAALAETEEG